MDKVRWGLIGCGDIARKRVAPALRDGVDCELAAVSRARAELMEAFAREFGARLAFANWRELAACPDLDAVYIATPVDLHAPQTIAAAEAGKHVLCEKPMALSPTECERMISACRANGVQLGVAYYRRFYPVLARMHELLASREIGLPVIAQVNAFERFHPGPEHPRRWLLAPERSGGGPMADFGCHRIELLLGLFGEVTEVRGLSGRVLFRDRASEDTCAAALHFANGTLATLTVSHAASEARDTLDIFGSDGSLHIASLNAGDLRVRTTSGQRIENHPPHANLHQPLIDDFCQALKRGRAPAVDGAAGMRVNEVLERIYSTGR